MKHTDKMAFYDNMLAELKALRAKTPDRRGRNDLLFIEIVWNYYLYKNFPGQTDGLEHILEIPSLFADGICPRLFGTFSEAGISAVCCGRVF